MKRKVTLFIAFLALAAVFAGCKLQLPEINLNPFDKGPIVCLVQAKDGLTLTVEVQSPDSHYDEGDTLIVAYKTIRGGTSVAVGDQVTFTYDYMTDVTVQNDYPYIVTESVELTTWTPPETTTEPETTTR